MSTYKIEVTPTSAEVTAPNGDPVWDSKHTDAHSEAEMAVDRREAEARANSHADTMANPDPFAYYYETE
jgi:hypothetical protein